jgi:hypothetical protein
MLTFTVVAKATAAKLNFPACSRYAKCSIRVRLQTKYIFIVNIQENVPTGNNFDILKMTVMKNNKVFPEKYSEFYRVYFANQDSSYLTF